MSTHRTTTPTLADLQPGRILLPCLLLFGAMFNLTLVVAGLKEFIIGELGGTVTDASLFFSVETFAYILFAPLWGILSDRLGRRRPFVVIGFLLSALIYASYILVQSVPTLLVLRFVQGAFAVMGWSLVMASVVDQPGGQRGRNMGLMGAALIFGVALGAPVGGYLTRWHGPRAPLVAAAALFALLALGALALAEPTRRQRGAAGGRDPDRPALAATSAAAADLPFRRSPGRRSVRRHLPALRRLAGRRAIRRSGAATWPCFCSPSLCSSTSPAS